MNGQFHVPATLPCGKRPQCLLNMRPGGLVWRRDKCLANAENWTAVHWVSSPLSSCSTDPALPALRITVLFSASVKMCREDMMACFKAMFRVLQVMCMNSWKPRERSVTVVHFWQRIKPGTSLTKNRESNNYILILSNSIITDMVRSMMLFLLWVMCLVR